MNVLVDPNSEMLTLLAEESTPTTVRNILEILSREDAKVARDIADRIDEVCERRFVAARNLDAVIHQVRNAEPDVARLNADCDATTGRLMKYIGKQIAQLQDRGTSQLVLVAAARAFICTSVTLSGVEVGLANVRSVFEETLDELAPMLREMRSDGVPIDEA